MHRPQWRTERKCVAGAMDGRAWRWRSGRGGRRGISGAAFDQLAQLRLALLEAGVLMHVLLQEGL